jgi:hypothetical protein
LGITPQKERLQTVRIFLLTVFYFIVGQINKSRIQNPGAGIIENWPLISGLWNGELS